MLADSDVVETEGEPDINRGLEVFRNGGASMEFIFKAILAGCVVSGASWLAGRSPVLAGFFVALPISTAILLPMVYWEHGSPQTVYQLARSIAVAVPLTLFFFIPFFLTRWLEINFWLAYAMAFVFLGAAFILHQFIMKLIEPNAY